MSRRMKHFRKIQGRPIPPCPQGRDRNAWEKAHTVSQASGIFSRALVVNGEIKDSDGNIMSRPMNPEKFERIQKNLK